MNYNELCKILDCIGFLDLFNAISTQKYTINFGQRKGDATFNREGAFAVYQCLYSVPKNKCRYTNILFTQFGLVAGDPVQNLNRCIDILDWGGMQAANIYTARTLFEERELDNMLFRAQAYFACRKNLDLPCEGIEWSAGWTKVYSLLFPYTTIYDSRVGGYLNYVFHRMLIENKNQWDEIRQVTRFLTDQTGRNDNGRSRSFPDLRDKFRTDRGLNRAKSNKIASWILLYIVEKEAEGQVRPVTLQQPFRKLEIAFFMLGFDLSQIKKS